jgi:hypothetical protein
MLNLVAVGHKRMLSVLLGGVFLAATALWLTTGIILDFRVGGMGVSDVGDAVELMRLSGWNMTAGRVALVAFALITVLRMLETPWKAGPVGQQG